MDAVEYVKTQFRLCRSKDNSTGDAYIEEFDSVKAAIKWLRREE